jgi:hypothetical protein
MTYYQPPQRWSTTKKWFSAGILVVAAVVSFASILALVLPPPDAPQDGYQEHETLTYVKESVPGPSTTGAVWISRPSDGELVRTGHEVWAVLNINRGSSDKVTYYPTDPGIMQKYPMSQRI